MIGNDLGMFDMKLAYIIQQLERQIKFDIAYGLDDNYYKVCFEDLKGKRLMGETVFDIKDKDEQIKR